MHCITWDKQMMSWVLSWNYLMVIEQLIWQLQMWTAIIICLNWPKTSWNVFPSPYAERISTAAQIVTSHMQGWLQKVLHETRNFRIYLLWSEMCPISEIWHKLSGDWGEKTIISVKCLSMKKTLIYLLSNEHPCLPICVQVAHKLLMSDIWSVFAILLGVEIL